MNNKNIFIFDYHIAGRILFIYLMNSVSFFLYIFSEIEILILV